MINVYMIRKGSEYLYDIDECLWDSSQSSACFFGSMETAQEAIVKISRKGNAYELIGTKIVHGSFEPIEAYDIIDSILKIDRWRKLYNILIKDHMPSELMLMTGLQSREAVTKLPVYKKIKTISKGFINWDKENKNLWWRYEAENCFKMFKSLAFYAMNAKFKLTKKEEVSQ